MESLVVLLVLFGTLSVFSFVLNFWIQFHEPAKNQTVTEKILNHAEPGEFIPPEVTPETTYAFHGKHRLPQLAFHTPSGVTSNCLARSYPTPQSAHEIYRVKKNQRAMVDRAMLPSDAILGVTNPEHGWVFPINTQVTELHTVLNENERLVVWCDPNTPYHIDLVSWTAHPGTPEGFRICGNITQHVSWKPPEGQQLIVYFHEVMFASSETDGRTREVEIKLDGLLLETVRFASATHVALPVQHQWRLPRTILSHQTLTFHFSPKLSGYSVLTWNGMLEPSS